MIYVVYKTWPYNRMIGRFPNLETAKAWLRQLDNRIIFREPLSDGNVLCGRYNHPQAPRYAIRQEEIH